MDGGYNTKDGGKKKRKTSASICPLPLCRLKGYKTKRSKKCKYNPNNPRYVGDEAAKANNLNQQQPKKVESDAKQTERDAVELELLDQIQLQEKAEDSDAFYSALGSIADSDTSEQFNLL